MASSWERPLSLWRGIVFSSGVSADKLLAATTVIRRAEEGGYFEQLADGRERGRAEWVAIAAPLVSRLLEPLGLRAGFAPRDPNLRVWRLKGSVQRRRG